MIIRTSFRTVYNIYDIQLFNISDRVYWEIYLLTYVGTTTDRRDEQLEKA